MNDCEEAFREFGFEFGEIGLALKLF